jgi:hypothetical protein
MVAGAGRGQFRNRIEFVLRPGRKELGDAGTGVMHGI